MFICVGIMDSLATAHEHTGKRTPAINRFKSRQRERGCGRGRLGGSERYYILSGRGVMDWIDPAQDGDQWRALVNTVMNLQVP
jgi:hypothetical protein